MTSGVRRLAGTSMGMTPRSAWTILVKRDVARAQQKADEEAEERATAFAGGGRQGFTQPAEAGRDSCRQ